MIDSHNAAAAVGLANSALSAVKSALELGKKTTDLSLKHELSNAVDSVLDLKVKVHELADENRDLRALLQQKEKITRTGEHGFWFREGETDPLCPKCYEDAGKTIYLTPAVPWNGGVRRDCYVCSQMYMEKPMNLAGGSIRPHIRRFGR
jgi:hypothetical protein